MIRQSTVSTLLLFALPACAQRPAPTPVATPAACWARASGAELTGRASAFDSATVQLDSGVVKVCYSRPKANDRVVMGGLVPYGQPWRLGANEATAIYLQIPAQVGSANLRTGWYSIYAIPGAAEWGLVINTQVQRWGIPINAAVTAADVDTIFVASEQIAQPEEAMRISLTKVGPNEATMIIQWERTRLTVPIFIDVISRPVN